MQKIARSVMEDTDKYDVVLTLSYLETSLIGEIRPNKQASILSEIIMTLNWVGYFVFNQLETLFSIT